MQTINFEGNIQSQNYIVDFYCHKLKLVIEVDGSIHSSEENQKLDEMRQKNLEKLGLTVFRFTNEDVRNKIEKVLDKINQFVKQMLPIQKIGIFNSKSKN